MMSFDAAMNEVLSEPKYNVLAGRAPDVRKMLTGAVMGVLKAIFELFNLPDTADYNTDIILCIFLAVAAAALISVGLLLYLHISRRRVREAAMEDIYSVLEDKGVSYGDLLTCADGFRRNGDYREAVRYRFIAVLYALNKSNIIYLHKSKTNAQLKRELRNNAPNLLPVFESIVGGFNHAWFGHKSLDEENYASYSADAGRIAEEAGKV